MPEITIKDNSKGLTYKNVITITQADKIIKYLSKGDWTMSTLRLCDKCNKDLIKIKYAIFNVEEVTHYIICRNHKIQFELCEDCIKEYNKLIYKWLGDEKWANQI